ncbi:hypothetical protein AwWohl_12620 [Gammaproteobacteria bacterium]|nr:hypothetical protein AwWohl_12620 [Gammaproteobacteria bacterium]
MTKLWFWAADLGNSKTAAAIIFLSVFISICLYLYVFVGKNRKKRYDDCSYIAILDDEDLTDLSASKAAFVSNQLTQKDSQIDSQSALKSEEK